MKKGEETSFRLRLAEGFIAEARQDIYLERWRSCMDNAQLAVENAAKTVLALQGPVGRTHSPAALLRDGLINRLFPEVVHKQIEDIAKCAELLGANVHIASDYGDEASWRTPWELFDEADARQALGLAEKAITLARKVIEGH